MSSRSSKIACIYRLTNLLTGQKYIGQTDDYRRRMDEHKWSKKRTKLSEGIQKYGWENFNSEIVVIVLEDEDLFGVPPQSEGKEVIGKKTWRNALGGHRGHEAVYFDLSQRFYWNGMYADVKAYIRIATHADKPNTQIPRGKTA